MFNFIHLIAFCNVKKIEKRKKEIETKEKEILVQYNFPFPLFKDRRIYSYLIPACKN